MPQCPICNAAIWVGQRYCSICDSYLPNPEEEDRFCPQCRIRVAPHQKLCNKCNASLIELPGASFPARARVRRFFPWVLGILIFASVVMMALFLIIFFK